MGSQRDDVVLLTGAAGRTGRRVLRALVARGANVRAFVRRPEASAAMLELGAAEVAVGDLASDADLRVATRGVTQALHICPPMHPQEDDIAGRMIDVCAVADARLILYSVLHPVVDVPHHRRKLAAEKRLIESGLRYTILQPARYMTHLAPLWSAVMAEGVHRLPFSVDARFSLVDLDDLAQATARVATEEGHDCATYELAGPQPLSQTDCARILSGLLGLTIRAQEAPLEAFCAAAAAAGAPAERVETMRQMNAHYSAHGLVGNPNVLTWLLGRAPTDFAAYVRREHLPADAPR